MTERDGTIPPIAEAFFLTGPTAGGKTKIGVRLAKLIGAEVVSLDSMAVYRMMDIGTAKPTVGEREGVPHHLIDLCDPWEEYSLANYLKDAARVGEEIRARGKRVLFVGGTPLYLKGALCGIFEGPPADAAYRAELAEREAAEPGSLHRLLAERAPDDAARLHTSSGDYSKPRQVDHLVSEPVSDRKRKGKPAARRRSRLGATGSERADQPPGRSDDGGRFFR